MKKIEFYIADEWYEQLNELRKENELICSDIYKDIGLDINEYAAILLRSKMKDIISLKGEK